MNSISHTGGIERVTVVKANALAAIDGNEVYVIVTDHRHGVGPSVHLSPLVHLVDLDVDYYDEDWKSKLHILKGVFVKRRVHKRRLAEVMKTIAPNVVISVGQAEKYMLPEIKGCSICIRELHYRKDFRRHAVASRSVFDKIAAFLSDFYDYRCKIGNYDRIVTLTHEDRALNWSERDRVSVIPNPLTFNGTSVSSLTDQKIVAFGRLTAQKNFSSLIRAFRIVAERHPDWQLEIYGDGDEHSLLQTLITEQRLDKHVHLHGSTPHVQEKMLGASIFVLSSRFEGLPLVLLEAMSCGLPVVSYACPCGPSDIITDGEDGFLVPVGDERMLAEQICYLIEHPDRRAEMGAAALKKSEQYRPEKIVPMWMDLFERLLQEKQNKC